MLPVTVADHAAQVRHDVDTLVKERDKLTRDYDQQVGKIDAQLLSKRQALDDYEQFFEWQHQRDGGNASIREMRRVLEGGGKLSPDEYDLALKLVLHVPDEQKPDLVLNTPTQVAVEHAPA